MFNNIFNSNTYKYNGNIERIDFIDNDSFFAVRNEIYGPACFITNFQNKTNEKILDIEFVHAHYNDGFIYYNITKNNIMYRYDISSKETVELFTYNRKRSFGINNDIIYLTGLGYNIDEFNLQGIQIDRANKKEIEHYEVKSFKNDYIYENIFDFTYKDAYIYLGQDKNVKKLDELTFIVKESAVGGDYLAVSTIAHTVNPKIKLFKINEQENNWDFVSEWIYQDSDSFVHDLKIINNNIYVVDSNNKFLILDLQCNILKSFKLKHEALCFSISPDNKKLAYAFGQYIEIIDISL